VTDHPIEAELKFRAQDDAPLVRLRTAESFGPAQLGAGRRHAEVDRYLDTADGRLASARWACRLRERGDRVIVSLKGPARHEPAATLHLRPELEGPANPSLDPADWPPSPARELLDTLRGGEPLVERLRLAQDRTERAVTVAGRAAGTLSIDVCRVLHDGSDLGELRVVELELGADAHDLAPALGQALRASGDLVPDAQSKLEHALALVDATPEAREA